MEDRFKFRVFDYDENKMVYFRNLFDIEKPRHDRSSMPNYYNDYKYHKISDYMQCTGVKDKNGRLIYEGDIVRCDRDFSKDGRVNLRKEVIFWLGSFKLANCNPHNRDACYIDNFHNIEIIDNIHEQAEQKDR